MIHVISGVSKHVYIFSIKRHQVTTVLRSKQQGRLGYYKAVIDETANKK